MCKSSRITLKENEIEALLTAVNKWEATLIKTDSDWKNHVRELNDKGLKSAVSKLYKA